MPQTRRLIEECKNRDLEKIFKKQYVDVECTGKVLVIDGGTIKTSDKYKYLVHIITKNGRNVAIFYIKCAKGVVLEQN